MPQGDASRKSQYRDLLLQDSQCLVKGVVTFATPSQESTIEGSLGHPRKKSISDDSSVQSMSILPHEEQISEIPQRFEDVRKVNQIALVQYVSGKRSQRWIFPQVLHTFSSVSKLMLTLLQAKHVQPPSPSQLPW